MVPSESGTLFVVATPIGNLADISQRAVDVLRRVAIVAAEDTRHSGRLLRACGIDTRMLSLHEHNEAARSVELVERLRSGEDVALISDAGTPLVSDPGYRLVRAAAAAGLRVSPVPGPSSVLAALSVAGLPSDRFVFEGFLPARAGPRRKRVAQLAAEARTLVLLESSHRVEASLGDLAEGLGGAREAVICRELTKLHETVLRGDLATLAAQVAADADQRRGEFTLIIAGVDAAPVTPASAVEPRALMTALLEDLPAGRAAAAAARATGLPRKELYAIALELGGT